MLEVSTLENAHGAGGRKKVTRNALKKRSLVKVIIENDLYCLVQALVVGEAHIALKKIRPWSRKKSGRARSPTDAPFKKQWLCRSANKPEPSRRAAGGEV